MGQECLPSERGLKRDEKGGKGEVRGPSMSGYQHLDALEMHLDSRAVCSEPTPTQSHTMHQIGPAGDRSHLVMRIKQQTTDSRHSTTGATRYAGWRAGLWVEFNPFKMA